MKQTHLGIVGLRWMFLWCNDKTQTLHVIEITQIILTNEKYKAIWNIIISNYYLYRKFFLFIQIFGIDNELSGTISVINCCSIIIDNRVVISVSN